MVIDGTENFHHPVNNLRGGCRRNEPESKFGEHFARRYDADFAKMHGKPSKNRLLIREMPINGSGIADLVAVDNRSCSAKAVVRAFEFKLEDWRQGLMQASRYKYFSNASILVVPSSKLRAIEPYLDLFRKLGVGLWGFNMESGAIRKVVTPRLGKIPCEKRAAEIKTKIRACF